MAETLQVSSSRARRLRRTATIKHLHEEMAKHVKMGGDSAKIDLLLHQVQYLTMAVESLCIGAPMYNPYPGECDSSLFGAGVDGTSYSPLAWSIGQTDFTQATKPEEKGNSDENAKATDAPAAEAPREEKAVEQKQPKKEAKPAEASQIVKKFVALVRPTARNKQDAAPAAPVQEAAKAAPGNAVGSGYSSAEVPQAQAMARVQEQISDLEARLENIGKPRIYLEVPFVHYERANALGATWDVQRKKWFAEPDTVSACSKWLPS